MVLLLSNLITIVLAVVFSWSLMIILWSYWLQSIIIGFFNFLKILTLKESSSQGMTVNGKPASPSAFNGIKIFIAFFFAFHYGGFHICYAFFLAMFTVFSFVSHSASFSDIGFIFLSGIIFFFNHLYSFLHYRNKPVQRSIGTLMFFPYARIFPMHLTIIFGGMFLFSKTGSVFVLVLFLVLKAIADLIMHSIEHKEQIKIYISGEQISM